MNQAARRAPAQPFFLDAHPGQRFCLYHAAGQGTGATLADLPASSTSAVDKAPATPLQGCRGAVVMVHAFAEEMNRARRMHALQARALADSGIAVLLIDLYGCGDSSGDFGDARWQIWIDDLLLAKRWLEQRTGAIAGFLGLRLGALLALDAAARATTAVGPLVLWQPVLRGETYLTQFLRLRQAGQMVANVQGIVADTGANANTKAFAKPVIGENAAEAALLATDPATGAQGSAALRRTLAGGEAVEVTGYLLDAQLAKAIDGADLAQLSQPAQLAQPDLALHWFDLAAEAHSPVAPARARAVALLRERGSAVSFQQVSGPAFWATQEISEAPALITATLAVFAEET